MVSLAALLNRDSQGADRMISVCMATYNGARWIEIQLGSILSQLSPEDEVVIVDDGSKDDTLDRVASFNDPRVRVLRTGRNRGELGRARVGKEGVSRCRSRW